MAEIDFSLPAFLEKVIEFSRGCSYELLGPLTDLKRCHDGTPAEDSILFTCRQTSPEPHLESVEEYVIKIKIQAPDQTPETGPSTTTSAELEALKAFSKSNNPYVPHLVSWKQTLQGPDGLLPGGYITYTVMTKMPGQTLLTLQYWTLPAGEREEIIQEFLPALRSIYSLGIEPIDCALRNVMWERETKKCTIIDFELWRESRDALTNETKELQRWGLARRPAPKSWWDEWNIHTR